MMAGGFAVVGVTFRENAVTCGDGLWEVELMWTMDGDDGVTDAGVGVENTNNGFPVT